mgnify:FL=1
MRPMSGLGDRPDGGLMGMPVEQLQRYRFAREFVSGRRVLIVSREEAAGTTLVAEVAAQVIDLRLTAAARVWSRTGDFSGHPAVVVVRGDCRAIPLADHCVDAVVSLETLGPLDRYAMALPEMRRVLRPGGLLILTGPDDSMSEPAERLANAFSNLLQGSFPYVALAEQLPRFGPGLVFAGPVAETRVFTRDGAPVGCGAAQCDRLALASDAPLPPLFNSLCLDLDVSSDAGHAVAAARPASDARIAALERALAEQTQRAAVATAQLAIERQRANTIEASTVWRATAPLRRFLDPFPRLRRLGRQALGVAARQRRAWLSRRAEAQRAAAYRPLVTAIVPNFNHARFLPQRLDSILQQTYPNLEVLILDDASTDDSVAVIERYQLAFPDRVRVLRNERNSGNVFRQWRKGVEAASGELIWICESDDFAELTFLANLVPAFADDSVMLGFGRIQFANRAGRPYAGLDAYRERAQRGIWSAPNVRPAKAWFDTAFGVANVIPNVGGCLIRRQPIEPEVWEEAANYRILGDWYLYAMLARGGRIAFMPKAVAYFRQHGSNTSVSGFTGAAYYTEHERLLRLLRQRWGVPPATVARFHARLQAQFDWAKAAPALGSLAAVFDLDKVLAVQRSARHILIVILGFYLGGGELFPIHLANELVRRGYIISVMTLQTHDWDARIRAQLDRRIAVYSANLMQRIGPARFLAEAGIDLVHSHFVGAENVFFSETQPAPDIPYVVTLHGSYEVIGSRPDFIRRIAQYVDHWVYLTPKNLDHLQLLPPAERSRISTSRIPNGMPLDPRPFNATRAELGIGNDDLVFALVSRAIPEKGWEVAIQALALAQARTQRRLVLLLCGAGPEADRLASLYADQPAVKFLGFQERVHGLYRLADCAILPTRFQGESFPLTLIQAMQVGTPVIATDVGEIASMLSRDGRRAGLVVPPTPDDTAFAESVAQAMLVLEDSATRAACARDAAALGQQFSMEAVATAYIACFDQVIERHRTRAT